MRTVQSQAGVMLIEALIGILIFSIGILALLGMQGTAMKNTTDARYRSEAALLAQQVVGLIWINDKLTLTNWDTRPLIGPNKYPPRDNWVAAVTDRLPGSLAPTIFVGPDAVEGLADYEIRVTVRWRHPGEEDKATTRQVVIVNRILQAETP